MHSERDIAQRKQRLLAEGAVYRASLAASMQEARQNLQADSLARRAAGFAATTAFGLIKGKGLTAGLAGNGIRLQGLLPVAIEAFSLIAKKPFLKKILRTVAVVAAGVGAVNMFRGKKKVSSVDDLGEAGMTAKMGDKEDTGEADRSG